MDGQSHRTVSTNHNLFRRERRAGAESNRGPSAYQPNALPLGQTGSRCEPRQWMCSLFLRAWSVGAFRAGYRWMINALIARPPCVHQGTKSTRNKQSIPPPPPRERQRQTDRQNSELKTLLLKDWDLGNSLFLQSVLAKLHRLLTLSKLTQYYKTAATSILAIQLTTGTPR